MNSKALKSYLAIVMLLLPASSFAQNKILKVSEKSKRVGIELGSLKAGDIVEAKSNGKSCQVKIIKVSDKLAIGDAASCESVVALNGQSVTLSSSDENWDEDSELDLDEPQSKVKRSKRQDKKKIGLGLSVYYSFADTIESKGLIGSYPFSESDKTDGQVGISLHYNNISNYHFGSFVSLDYELERKIKSGSGKIGSLSYSGRPADARFSFINVTTNIGYGIYDNTLVYGGINYPLSISAKNSGADYVGSIGCPVPVI